MSPASEKFLGAIRNNDADVRYAAWSHAGEADPEVITELGKLLDSSQPGVRKAADEALKGMVHSVGKEPGGTKRAAVVKQLMALASGGPVWVRTVALRQLSLVGGDETVPLAAKLLRDPQLQEEAVFCLERIPGPASDAALLAAVPQVADGFKPRILAALGHRRVEEAAEACAMALGSKNPDIAMTGMKALARIGRKPKGEAKPPDRSALSPWQKTEYDDSYLRFADDQIRRGNKEEAIRIYRDFLNRPEEHLQCAAIIGLSKTDSPESAGLIYTKLKSANTTVRITAGKAWAAMGKAG
jgi:hypothetical protein